MANKIEEKNELIEKVVEVRRVSKVVKGGRRFSFSALVVVGDGNGNAGYGLGKANEVIEAVRKATEQAKKNMKFYVRYKNTIPHQIEGRFCSEKVLIMPAQPGSGIIAIGAVRSVMECLGVLDINVKSIGSRNPHNLVRATLNGLSQLKSFEEIAVRRNKAVENICFIGF